MLLRELKMDKNKKRGRFTKKQPLFNGAGGGTRTHTESPPADFESATSTIPSHRHLRCPVYNIRSSFSSYIFSVTKFL